MKRIGLTGAAGCGKSTVLKIFRDFGWEAVDADAICAELHRNPESGIHPILRERWGERVIAEDGTTEKRTVAEIVFAEENERKWLEEIERKLKYDHWFCGHWHIDKHIDRMHFLFHSVEAAPQLLTGGDTL